MTRIVAFWPFLELVAGATGESEMASRTAARSPPPTRAGGQDDGSYTNSLKRSFLSYQVGSGDPQERFGELLQTKTEEHDYYRIIKLLYKNKILYKNVTIIQ